MICKFYYTLKDIVRRYNGNYNSSFQVYDQFDGLPEIYQSIIGETLPDRVIKLDQITPTVYDKYYLELEQKIIENCLDVCIAKSEEELDLSITQNQKIIFESFFQKFFNWYFRSKEKYAVLIDIYAAQLSNIKALKGSTNKGSSVNKFNDVPQDVVTSLDTDTYLSTVNRNDVDNEASLTPLEEIEKVQRLYNDIYDAWLNDFIRCFAIGR